jgi:hypothetical protein
MTCLLGWEILQLEETVFWDVFHTTVSQDLGVPKFGDRSARSEGKIFLCQQDTCIRLCILSARTVVPNLSYAYLWEYATDRLGVRENNMRIGGRHKKIKGVEMKIQKQSYEVLVYKERLMRKLSLDTPTASHIIILMLFLFVLIFCYAANVKVEINCEM